MYAKALCLLLEALGGSEKSRLDIGGGSVDATFRHPLSGNSASNLLALYPFDGCKLLINILSSSLNIIAYKYCSDV